jgi:hypothetical protein
MIDNDAYLMVAIFQKMFQLEKGIADPAKYVKRHELRIKKAGQLLEYLGLAEQDAESSLGWKPTRRLIEIIADRLSKNLPRGESYGDDHTSHFLSIAVFGRGETEDNLGYEMLHALGLLRETSSGDWKATQQLKELFSHGYNMEIEKRYRD